MCISFEMWCWRRMEKISWTDHVRNEEVLLTVNEQRNILHEIRKRKANWTGHSLRINCLLKQVIEGMIEGEMEVTRRRGRRRKKLLDDLKDRRGYSPLKEEALNHTIWRYRFGGVFGPVVRQNTEWMNEWTKPGIEPNPSRGNDALKNDLAIGQKLITCEAEKKLETVHTKSDCIPQIQFLSYPRSLYQSPFEALGLEIKYVADFLGGCFCFLHISIQLLALSFHLVAYLLLTIH